MLPFVCGASNPSVGGGGGGGNIITTLDLINTSGSTQAASFVTEMFGLAFNKGDIPGSAYPKLELQDGTPVPVTIWDKTVWSDGSWKRCSCIARIPTSVAGSATLNVVIKDNGTAPSASGFTTADLNATVGKDFKIDIVGFENLTGSWTSAVNVGVSDNDWLWSEGNGDAGRVYTINQEFRDGASNHAHLVCRHYIAVLKNSSGGVYGYYYMPLIMQPRMNTASPARRAFTCAVFDGATQLISFDNAKAATYAGTNGRLTITAHGYSNGEAIRLTTTGALPTGLNTSTVYFVKVIDANTVEIWTSPFAVETGSDGTIVSFTSSGQSGAHTATRVVGIEHHGGFFGANAAGQCHFIAGTGARSTVRVLQQRAYLKSTKLFPPYDLTLTPTAAASIDYGPNTAANQRRFIGAGGGSVTIGLQPEWVARHFLRQTETDDRIVRVNGLVNGHIPIWVYDETTRQPPVINNRSYTGLPASSLTVRYSGIPTGGPGASGMTLAPSQYNFYSAFDTSHNCAGPHYAYLIFGCPWFRDIIIQFAIMTPLGRYTAGDGGFGEGRLITGIPGDTTYYATGMFYGGSLERVDAWSMREMFAGFLLPDSHPDGSQIVNYCRDLATNSADAYVAWRNSRSQAYRDNGVYEFVTRADGQGSPWAKSYLSQTWAWGACISEDADTITIAQHFANWYVALSGAGGIYHLNAYMYNTHSIDVGNSGGPDNAITDITLMTFLGYNVTTNATTDVITINPASEPINDRIPPIANGDRVSFNSKMGAVPGGLTAFNIYYAVQVSGNTFKLSTTPGGAAINITSSITVTAFWHHTSVGAGITGTDGITGNGSGAENYEAGYTGVHRAAIMHLMAAGVTGLSTALADINTILSNGSANFTAFPKNALTSSFT